MFLTVDMMRYYEIQLKHFKKILKIMNFASNTQLKT